MQPDSMIGGGFVLAVAYLVLLGVLFGVIVYRARLRGLRNDSGYGTFPKD